MKQKREETPEHSGAIGWLMLPLRCSKVWKQREQKIAKAKREARGEEGAGKHGGEAGSREAKRRTAKAKQRRGRHLRADTVCVSVRVCVAVCARVCVSCRMHDVGVGVRVVGVRFGVRVVCVTCVVRVRVSVYALLCVRVLCARTPVPSSARCARRHAAALTGL